MGSKYFLINYVVEIIFRTFKNFENNKFLARIIVFCRQILPQDFHRLTRRNELRSIKLLLIFLTIDFRTCGHTYLRLNLESFCCFIILLIGKQKCWDFFLVNFCSQNIITKHDTSGTGEVFVHTIFLST